MFVWRGRVMPKTTMLLVPFVEETDCFFLKTIIPSRKATRDYLQQGEPNAEE
jgi:hypothetical protein